MILCQALSSSSSPTGQTHFFGESMIRMQLGKDGSARCLRESFIDFFYMANFWNKLLFRYFKVCLCTFRDSGRRVIHLCCFSSHFVLRSEILVNICLLGWDRQLSRLFADKNASIARLRQPDSYILQEKIFKFYQVYEIYLCFRLGVALSCYTENMNNHVALLTSLINIGHNYQLKNHPAIVLTFTVSSPAGVALLGLLIVWSGFPQSWRPSYIWPHCCPGSGLSAFSTQSHLLYLCCCLCGLLLLATLAAVSFGRFQSRWQMGGAGTVDSIFDPNAFPDVAREPRVMLLHHQCHSSKCSTLEFDLFPNNIQH